MSRITSRAWNPAEFHINHKKNAAFHTGDCKIINPNELSSEEMQKILDAGNRRLNSIGISVKKEK